ncbi:HNH endonuclease [Peribacillus frigoritolerans]|uniref:HNH endonuclease n=1 Tax=Peribacillus TaxID=2675229 RepID=UPI002ED2565C|nr:HNH endonuclease [Peribacillus frigoritolerans]
MRFKYEELSSAPLLINSIYEGGSKRNPAADDPLTKLFKVEGYIKSVGNRGGFRKSNKEIDGKSTSEIAYVVIFTTGKEEEWPDTFYEETGTFIYYGDNRVPGDYLKTKQNGNMLLKDIFEKAYSSPESRKDIPPIFVFKSTGVGFNVEFLGVAVPGIKGKALSDVLELTTGGEGTNQFQNYKAHFTMINIGPEGVSRKWLAELKGKNISTNHYAPKEWNNFIENGPERLTPLDSKNKKTIDNTYDVTLPSEKQYLRKVRLTQGKFRENLLNNSPVCKVCGMNMPQLLIASHIKPWRYCNDYERIDSHNGLLLCPTHDAAFDGGYISFDDEGNMVISHLVSSLNSELLRLNIDNKIELDPMQLEYMKWHRDEVFKKK